MAIRQSVYVGIGGTGIMAISYAKKLFEDAYGKGRIPQEIAFAAIDYDLGAPNDKNLATDMRDDFLKLYTIGSPRQQYEVGVKRGKYNWVFPSNSTYIGDRVSDGASQVRTYGRFLSEMIQDEVLRRLTECINQVQNIQNGRMDVVDNQPIDVHIAMSLAGGTGCGSFLNVAHLLKTTFGNQINIIGYGVLHSVFRAMDVAAVKTPRVVANAYSAILDLDYLMSASDTNPRRVSFNGKTTELTSPIFDEFYVIDNQTERGKVVDHINKLCEVVGTCLFVASTDLGTKVRSGSSNTGWKQGSYNISPKVGWVQALGACQVVYKGDLLAEVYALQAATNLIQNLLNSTINPSIAVDWAKEVQIKEDEADDQLIDSIYDIKKARLGTPALDPKDSIAEIKSIIERYINSRPGYPNDEVLRLRFKEIKDSLNERLNTILNAENGIGNAVAFLDTLKSKVNLYRSEMEQERAQLETTIAANIEMMPSEYKDYEAYAKKLFVNDKKKSAFLEDGICVRAKRILKDRLEAERRKDAAEIFTLLLAEINILIKKIEELKSTFISIQKNYNHECNDKQSSASSSKVFEYDLSAQERTSMNFVPRDGFITGYFSGLKKSLSDIDNELELSKTILDYCSNLQEAKVYREKLIVDVLDELNEEEYAKLKSEIEIKSSRLLCLDSRGEVMPTRNDAAPTNVMVQNYFISLYLKGGQDNRQRCRLQDDRAFLPEVGDKNKDFIHTEFDSMKQKIIFYRSDMAIIPYCIKSFSENVIEREYEVLIRDAQAAGSTSFNPHCDKHIYEDMRKIDFKLKPEMTNEAEFYWVCGQLFGWTNVVEQQYIMEKDFNGNPLKIASKENVEHTKYIRCYKGKYQIWNETSKTMSLDGKWESLGNTTQRERAYSFFKTNLLPEIKLYLHAKILMDRDAKGKEYYSEIIKNIIADGMADYIDKLVCSDKNSLTYFSKNNGETEQLIQEWNYIEQELLNALNNLKTY